MSAVKKGGEQGLIISLGGTAGHYGRLDTGRQFCTHRTSCPGPRLALNALVNPSMYMLKNEWKR